MEPHSQTEDSPYSRNVLEGQLRDAFGRVVYSHKTHEKCADMLLNSLGWIKFWQIALSAITTAGFVGSVLGSNQVGATVGILVSVVLLSLNAYTKNFDLGELAQKHKQAANALWLVREKYQSLLADVAMREKPLESLQTQRDMLVEELANIYSAAPSTNDAAYKKAQKALKFGEDMTFTSDEIDAFLPGVLRKPTKPEPRKTD